MNGRFCSDCMRCASRAGRIESVKLADVSNCWVVRGGLPCLRVHRQLASKDLTDNTVRVILLDEIREGQGIERQARKLRDVTVGDSSCVQAVYPSPWKE